MKYSSFAKSYVFLGDSPFYPLFVPDLGQKKEKRTQKPLKTKGIF